ncbi:hypothetical protein AB0F43_29790 [Kribbella sp. NPDC023972]|uniref:hypothetical protein n=1 Tax=Kribbella sp. NPDC023972 TaxID=3154795 RepID=UPI0033F86CF4
MVFMLPDGWYSDTIAELIDTKLPGLIGELTDETAWKYVYACTLWTEEIKGIHYLHLNDRLSTVAGKAAAVRGLEWIQENFLADRSDPREHLDQVGKAYETARRHQSPTASWQRNNVTGRTFEVVLQELVFRLCGVEPMREPRLRTLQGFELTPPGYHSQPDLALFGPNDFRLIISTKWSLRKERIGTYLHESWFYKQRRSDLQTVFVVSDFNSNIVSWLVGDPLVDRVYHVSLPMLLAVHYPFEGRVQVPVADLIKPTATRDRYERWLMMSRRVHDLSQLFKDIRALNTD